MEYLRTFTKEIEQVSVDEGYMDFTGIADRWNSPVDGAVSALYVSSGAQVYQGQLLCEIQDLTQLELNAQVDEVYLSRVKVGDTLTFTLDAYADREYTGQVTESLPLGVEMQNATYYEVRLTISNAQDLLPGMSGTLYIS